jgi:hypothetical protein
MQIPHAVSMIRVLLLAMDCSRRLKGLVDLPVNHINLSNSTVFQKIQSIQYIKAGDELYHLYRFSTKLKY